MQSFSQSELRKLGVTIEKRNGIELIVGSFSLMFVHLQEN